MSLELEDVKAHLRVMHDHEDTVILTCWDAAIGHVEQYLGDDLPEPLPSAIEAAVLLLVGDLYENRTKQADRVLYENRTYELLLAPYRSAEVM